MLSGLARKSKTVIAAQLPLFSFIFSLFSFGERVAFEQGEEFGG